MPNYTTCATYNISTVNTTLSPFDLQYAYDVGIINIGAVTYRILYGCLYIILLLWSIWQYGKHAYDKKLWFDNRQVVVVCILLCSLLRSIQFFIKAITDCNPSVSWIDELFTALETIVQFCAFTLLISFWVELQLNVKQGLKSLQKTKKPTSILIGVFFVVRMTEFVFIILSDDKKNAFNIDRTISKSNIFHDLALVFRIFNVLLYSVVLGIAAYWGKKLLFQLRAFEKKIIIANNKAAAKAAKAEGEKSKMLERGERSLSTNSRSSGGGGGGGK